MNVNSHYNKVISKNIILRCFKRFYIYAFRFLFAYNIALQKPS